MIHMVGVEVLLRRIGELVDFTANKINSISIGRLSFKGLVLGTCGVILNGNTDLYTRLGLFELLKAEKLTFVRTPANSRGLCTALPFV